MKSFFNFNNNWRKDFFYVSTKSFEQVSKSRPTSNCSTECHTLITRFESSSMNEPLNKRFCT